MSGQARPVLLGHVARRRDEQAMAERDLTKEVLTRRVVLLGGVDDCRLIAERNGLEEIAESARFLRGLIENPGKPLNA